VLGSVRRLGNPKVNPKTVTASPKNVPQACQRIRCPVSNDLPCAGKGVCRTVGQIAALDFDNIYELWDKHSISGCVCDAGFKGPACNKRRCKHGFDPMYTDTESAAVRFSNWSYVIYASASPASVTLSGSYSITFYDAFDAPWTTDFIELGAVCGEVIDALERLPNNVIKKNSVRCLRWPDYNLIGAKDEPVLKSPNPYYGVKYTLAFPANPGRLLAPKVNFFSNDNRATLQVIDFFSSFFSPQILKFLMQILGPGLRQRICPGQLRVPQRLPGGAVRPCA
jgi:hypothetical protein